MFKVNTVPGGTLVHPVAAVVLVVILPLTSVQTNDVVLTRDP